MKDENLPAPIVWKESLQKQRQSAEATVSLTRVELKQRILAAAHKSDLEFISKSDDLVIYLRGGGAEITCRLSEESLNRTKLCINTDNYSPAILSYLCLGVWMAFFFFKNQIPSAVGTAGMFGFIGSVIYIEIQKVKAVGSVTKFKNSLNEVLRS